MPWPPAGPAPGSNGSPRRHQLARFWMPPTAPHAPRCHQLARLIGAGLCYRSPQRAHMSARSLQRPVPPTRDHQLTRPCRCGCLQRRRFSRRGVTNWPAPVGPEPPTARNADAASPTDPLLSMRLPPTAPPLSTRRHQLARPYRRGGLQRPRPSRCGATNWPVMPAHAQHGPPGTAPLIGPTALPAVPYPGALKIGTCK